MWTATIKTNTQDNSGSIDCVVTYSNGNISFDESYNDANSETMKATISSRISQLQAAADFVDGNPTGTEITCTTDVPNATIKTTVTPSEVSSVIKNI